MSTVGMGEFRSRLRAVPPSSVQYDNIPTSEGHILNYTLERIRPEGNLSNYSFEGNNSVVFIIESASHFLDCGRSYFKYRIILRDNGPDKNVANLTFPSNMSVMERTNLSEGPMAPFRQMYTTVAGTVVEDFRRINLCHSIIEDATVDLDYRNSIGIVENMGNLLRRQAFHYYWPVTDATTGASVTSVSRQEVQVPELTYQKALTDPETAWDDNTGDVLAAFDTTQFFRVAAGWAQGLAYTIPEANGVDATAKNAWAAANGQLQFQPDEQYSSNALNVMKWKNHHGQVVQCNPISGLLQHRKHLPSPVMGPIRVEWVLENPNTCMYRKNQSGLDLYYEISDFEFIAHWVEPDYDLMRTIVAQVKRPGGILLPYSTFQHNQATLGTSDQAVTIRLKNGPQRIKSSITTMHPTSQLTKVDRDYLKNYPFAQYQTAADTDEAARLDHSSFPVSINWRVGAQTYPRQPITFKNITDDHLTLFNQMSVIPDLVYAYTEYQKAMGLFKDRTVNSRIRLENYGSVAMQGVRINSGTGDLTTEAEGYVSEFDEFSEERDWGVFAPVCHPDKFYTLPLWTKRAAQADAGIQQFNMRKIERLTAIDAGTTTLTGQMILPEGPQAPQWLEIINKPLDLQLYKGKFVMAMSYEADSSNPHFGGVNLGPGAELNLDITFNKTVRQPLSVHTFSHVDQVLNIRPNGAHQILK